MEILGGTGRDGIFLGKILGGTGRVFFFRGGTGRLLFFSRSGTGGLYFFSEVGRGGCIFFPRRDGAVVIYFRGGTGRGGCVFSAPGPGGCIFWDLPICSPWTFRENHSPDIIYTVNRRNQPTAMDLYFLDWVRTRYKTEPETHTKSAHTVL